MPNITATLIITAADSRAVGSTVAGSGQASTTAANMMNAPSAPIATPAVCSPTSEGADNLRQNKRPINNPGRPQSVTIGDSQCSVVPVGGTLCSSSATGINTDTV